MNGNVHLRQKFGNNHACLWRIVGNADEGNGALIRIDGASHPVAVYDHITLANTTLRPVEDESRLLACLLGVR
jgi:hypothetical protein